MNSIELIPSFLALISVIVLCVTVAYTIRFYRLSFYYYDQRESLDDRKEIDFPAGYICIGVLVAVCLFIIHGMLF